MLKVLLFTIFIFRGFVNPLNLTYDVEDDEVDYIFSGINRNGDPGRRWPDSVYGLKNEICATYNNDLFKVINYVLKKYDENLYLQIITRLYINELMRMLHSICFNDDSKAEVLKVFKILNNKVNELKVERDQLMIALTFAADPQKSVDLSTIICYFDLYHKNIINILPTNEAKLLAKTLTEALSKAVATFAKTLVKKENQDCDYKSIKSNDLESKRKSIEMVLIDALAIALKYKDRSADPIVVRTQTTEISSLNTTNDMTTKKTESTTSSTTTVPTTTTTRLTTTTEEEPNIYTNPLAELSTVSNFNVQSLRNPLRKQG